MKKKVLTIEEIEKKLKVMGGIEVSEKEFNTAAEYKDISKYVEQMFKEYKGHKRNRISKVKTFK